MPDKKLGYITTIGYSSEKALKGKIVAMKKIGYIVAVDENGQKKIFPPKVEKGNWTAVLVKIKITDKEISFEEYNKTAKEKFIPGTKAYDEAEKKYKEDQLRLWIVRNEKSF